jgi:TonB family protein
VASSLHSGYVVFCIEAGEGGVQVQKRLVGLPFGLLLLGSFLFLPPAFSQDARAQAAARRLKFRVDPKYPDLAKQYQLSGKVKIEVTVSPDGVVKKTRIVGGNALLVGAALEAVKQWKYEPAGKETTEITEVQFQNTGK